MTDQRSSINPGALPRVLLLACLLNLTTAGCFSPQPLGEAPAPDTDVQVRLGDEAARRISYQAGRAVGVVSGRVVRSDPDSLVLAVRWREIAGGSSGRPGPDVVRLGASDIVEVMRPQFSLSRTLFLVGGVALLVAALGSDLFGTGGGNPDDGENGRPPDVQ